MTMSTLRGRVLASIAQQQAPATGGRPAPASPTTTGEAPAPEAPATLDEAADGDPVQQSADAALAWLRRYEGHITDALPSHMKTPGAFLAAVRAVLPELRSCTPASVLQSVLTCARFGLVPDGREAVITAESGRAVFIPTYRGYIALMHRSGQVASVRVGMVRATDEYSLEPTAPSPLDFTHRYDPALTDEERGRPLFAYAFLWSTDGHRSQVVTVNREQMEEARSWSRAYVEAEASGKRDSAWHTHESEMWWKTAVRRLEKVVPVSAEVRALVEVDRAGEEGRVQLLHAPDPEAAALMAEADRAARAAEASQDQASGGLSRKRRRGPALKRSQPRRTTRRGRKGRGRRS